MNERDRYNQSDWSQSDRFQADRDNRNQRGRQPQQWREDGSGGQVSDRQDQDDRFRDADQQGGYSSYGGGDHERNRADRPDKQDRPYAWNYQSGGENRGSDDRADRGPGNAGYYRSSGNHGSSRFDDGSGGTFGGFGANDFGGRDTVASGRRSGSGGGAGYGNAFSNAGDYGRGDRSAAGVAGGGAGSGTDDYGDWRSYGESRGFLTRAGDEVASWFGDEDAARRREQDHAGRGPSGYTRSDDRIREDANDTLTHDRNVDATHITVKVENGEVTLDGSVGDRQSKRRAEDAVDRVSGVKHVQNNLRVDQSRAASRADGGSTATGKHAASLETGATASTQSAGSAAAGGSPGHVTEKSS